MSDIDWSKSVEYERNGDVVPVLHTFVLHSVRYVVMNSGLSQPGRELVVREVADLLGTFRNVRRKVKHRKYVAFALYRNGEIGACQGDTLSEAEAKCRQYARDLDYEVRLHPDPIEWEADADE